MIDLPQVTLNTLATYDHAVAAHALLKARKICNFGDTWVITNKPDEFAHVPRCRFHMVEPFKEHADICIWAFHELPAIIASEVQTTHIMAVHWDGFPIREECWDDRFLDCDWIGSPMFGNIVGNGGFCMTTKELWRCVAGLQVPRTIDACYPSDQKICMHYRTNLEGVGIKFAPLDVANKWGKENLLPVGDTFGFHGRLSIGDVVRQGLYTL